jgi:exo-poly-alpha-galacturonosidase
MTSVLRWRTGLLLAGLYAMLVLPAAAGAASYVPARLLAPPQSLDAHSAVLVWSKPEGYADINDYQVFMNGKLLGTAQENARQSSPAQPWVDAFYAEDRDGVHVRVQPHVFNVGGLKPATRYRFTVRAVLRKGGYSAHSAALTLSTPALAPVCDIRRHGAVGDGQTLNTGAIQDTINACPQGGTVRVPAGVFKSGAIFLKSNMTLEVAEGGTLLGSQSAADYPLARGYTLYEYSTTRRPPSLINALDPGSRRAGSFRNIRIIGRGTIDGNGFKRAEPASITGEAGISLPVYVASNNRKVLDDGILAADQVATALKNGVALATAYGQYRSSLMTLRGVENLYMAGLTLVNPAFHGVMVLESENVTANGLSVQTFDVNNGDGLEFGNSAHVMVFNSLFDTGDDCVNFAAGTGLAAEQQPPQRDAWIFNNYMRKGHGAVVLGSHTGAWIEDVVAEDNVVNLTWSGLRAKTNNLNGGGARRVLYRDNAHRDLQREPFVLTTEYSDPNALIDYAPARATGHFEDFTVQRNSVEYSARWQPTPVTQGGVLKVVNFNAILVQGDVKNRIYHDNVVFEDLLLIGASPVKIDGLRNGVLSNVTFRAWKGGGQPWEVSNAPGTRFQDIQLQPAAR